MQDQHHNYRPDCTETSSEECRWCRLQQSAVANFTSGCDKHGSWRIYGEEGNSQNLTAGVDQGPCNLQASDRGRYEEHDETVGFSTSRKSVQSFIHVRWVPLSPRHGASSGSGWC
jgi:hypothetical protein